jgi:hypothetical protein
MELGQHTINFKVSSYQQAETSENTVTSEIEYVEQKGD